MFLMGGGIGVPPILELAKEMKCEKKQIVVGYRDAETFLREEFEQNGEVYISTEDGSVGTKGNVMDAIGGKTGLRRISSMPVDRPRCSVPSRRMPRKTELCVISPWKSAWTCGIGACLACVCQTKEKDHHSNVNNKRIC